MSKEFFICRVWNKSKLLKIDVDSYLAGWFSWTKIHTLEKRGLPEFFNGKTPGKTPKLYMEYRNIILNKYRENVKKIITVADVQELLVGLDEKTISRVLEFFDHWGLINYQAPAEFRPLWQSPAQSLDSDMAGILSALPLKGSSLYEFDSLRAPVSKKGHVNSKSADVAISELLALPEGPEVEYHCNSCAADCSKQRYHCQKQVSFISSESLMIFINTYISAEWWAWVLCC